MTRIFKHAARKLVIAGVLVGLATAAPIASAQNNGPKQDASVSVDITFYIGGSAVNIRTGPGTSYSRHSVYKLGHEVRIYERRNDWARISAPGQQALWVYYPLLTRDKPGNPNPTVSPAHGKSMGKANAGPTKGHDQKPDSKDQSGKNGKVNQGGPSQKSDKGDKDMRKGGRH